MATNNKKLLTEQEFNKLMENDTSVVKVTYEEYKARYSGDYDTYFKLKNAREKEFTSKTNKK
jgi:hypothetical protein